MLPRGCHSAPELSLFSTLNSDGHFVPERSPQISIVAPWPPKMSPKWSPKWGQGKNGRPFGNMHRHRQIACPPALGSSIFVHFSKMQNIAPQITHKTQQSKKRARKGSQKGFLFPVKIRKNPTCFRPWPSLGSRWGLEVPNITKMTSRTLPGSLIFDQQRVEKGQDFPPGVSFLINKRWESPHPTS